MVKTDSGFDSRQLPVFLRPTLPPVLARPVAPMKFACSGCGKQIIKRRRTADGAIVSEYCDQAGRCFGCAHARP